ncbi:MAG: hypothetical protein ACF8XB_24850 [Planctomycetota bacterium JB042]
MARTRLGLPLLLLVTLLAGLSGCRARPVALAPSTVPVADGTYTVLGPTEGTAFGVTVFIFSFGDDLAGTARDRAIASAQGADGLVDVSVAYTPYYLPLVTITETKVRGNAYRLSN